MDAIIKTSNLCVKYGKKHILRDINIEIPNNSICAILGPNGSGKSTLLKAILNCIMFSGDIFVKENEKLINTREISAKHSAKLIAYVPQHYEMGFEFSVLDVILMGNYARSGFFGYAKKYRDLAISTLNRLGIAHLKDEQFSILSGGQRQLVLIARALVQQSQIIVLDEPVSGLDLGNIHHLLELLALIKEEGKTIIQTTHYPEHTYNSNHIILLKNGELFQSGGSEVLSPEVLYEIYGLHTQKIELPHGRYYFAPLENDTNAGFRV